MHDECSAPQIKGLVTGFILAIFFPIRLEFPSTYTVKPNVTNIAIFMYSECGMEIFNAIQIRQPKNMKKRLHDYSKKQLMYHNLLLGSRCKNRGLALSLLGSNHSQQ